MDTSFATARRRFAPVHFVCDRPGTRSVRGKTLTIHEGKWAYCGSVHREPHRWVPTGGVSFSELIPDSRRKTARA